MQVSGTCKILLQQDSVGKQHSSYGQVVTCFPLVLAVWTTRVLGNMYTYLERCLATKQLKNKRVDLRLEAKGNYRSSYSPDIRLT